MTTIVRGVGYTGGLQRLVWLDTGTVRVRAYLWGGGGGAGGLDATTQGGNGSGGGYSEFTFDISAGDVIDVAVGGGGGNGTTNFTGGAPGGLGGSSFVQQLAFDSRSPPGGGVSPKSDRRWSNFMNTHAVWENNVYAPNFNRSYTVNFPVSANYTFTWQVDNSAQIFLDGIEIGRSGSNFRGPSSVVTRFVSGGNHTLAYTCQNAGDVGGFAMTVSGGFSFSGGNGSAAGPSPYSGGGGGGGGATVLLLNSNIVAVAGGGAGGGGAGNRSIGLNAPSNVGRDFFSSAGENGQPKSGDGGGAGGGGGGSQGGNGGFINAGDSGGAGGDWGSSSGSRTSFSSSRSAANSSSAYYPGAAGRGGSRSNQTPGNAGYAAIEFDVPNFSVKHEGQWRSVQKVWVNNNGIWRPVPTVYVRNNNQWQATIGAFPPIFTGRSGSFGAAPRPFT